MKILVFDDIRSSLLYILFYSLLILLISNYLIKVAIGSLMVFHVLVVSINNSSINNSLIYFTTLPMKRANIILLKYILVLINTAIFLIMFLISSTFDNVNIEVVTMLNIITIIVLVSTIYIFFVFLFNPIFAEAYIWICQVFIYIIAIIMQNHLNINVMKVLNQKNISILLLLSLIVLALTMFYYKNKDLNI